MSNGGITRVASAEEEAAVGSFPCTLLQERLWKQQRTRGPQGLNVAMRWLIEGPLPHATAERALQAVVDRHEILRTSFRETGEGLRQLVWPTATMRLNDIDLSALGGEGARERADEISREEALEPIDLGAPPLLRATLLRLSPDRAMLLLTFHSMVADGWSTGLVVREFDLAARALDAGRTPALPTPDLQFADYALWEREMLASDALDEARSFWRQQLRDAAGTAVPADADAPCSNPTEASGERSNIVSLLMPAGLSQALERRARERSTTLFGLAGAALALMLHRVTGQSDVVFGSQVANREEQVAEDMVGPTVNAITLRVRVDGDARVSAFIDSASRTILEAIRHEKLPYEVAESFAPDTPGRPLHAVNLVLHRSYSGTSATESSISPGRFRILSLPSFPSGTQWPLNFFMIGRDEGWRLSCEADVDLYDVGTAQSLLDAWLTCLEVLAKEGDVPLAACASLRSIEERRAPSMAVAPAGGALIPVRAPDRQVVRFNEHGTRTPLVLLNNRSVYFQLARHMGEDRPVVDIMLYHQDGPLDLGARTFEEFGAYAVQLIRWAQPRGPYLLGGHCVYGVLAFEAARQLRRAGETVSTVALFDSWAPGYRETMSRWDQMLRRQQLRLARYVERIGKYRRGEVGLDALLLKPVLFHLGLLREKAGPERQAMPGEWFDDYLYDAVTRYRPDPYDGDVVLFRSNEPLRGRLFDERMGWGPLVTGTFTKVDIDSGHFDMFRERPAQQIARLLRDR